MDMALKSLDFRLSVDTIQEKFHSEVIKWLLNETINAVSFHKCLSTQRGRIFFFLLKQLECAGQSYVT